MKKSTLLLFTMALLAVVAFASVAGAATQLLGVDGDGYFQVLTVDKDSGISPSGLSRTGGDFPGKLRNGNNVRLFSYGDGKVAVIHGANRNEAVVYYIDTASGTVNLDRTFAASNGVSASGTDIDVVKAVLTFNGEPVFITAEEIGTSPTAVGMIAASVDVAFVYDSKFYVIAPVSLDVDNSRYNIAFKDADFVKLKGLDDDDGYTTTSGETVRELVSISTPGLETYEQKKAAALKGIGGITNISGDACLLPSVVLGDTLYFIPPNGGGGLYTATLGSSGAALDSAQGFDISNPTYENARNFAGGAYRFEALYKLNDTAVYAVAVLLNDTDTSQANRVVAKVTFGNGAPTVEKTGLTSTTLNGNSMSAAGSFDVFGNDEVIVVVKHGVGIAAYDASTLDLIGTNGVRSAAMISPVSNSNNNSNNGSDSTSSTVANINDLDPAIRNEIIAAAGASAANQFVPSASDATTPTLTDAQKAQIASKFGNPSADVKAVAAYTLSNEGFLLLTQSVPSASKAYLVDTSILAAADASGINETELLGADGKVISSGNSTYVASKSSLDNGKTYTLVTAAAPSSSNSGGGSTNNNGGSDNTNNNNNGEDNNNGSSTSSSSGGGCNAGFAAISALLALALIKKSK